MNFIRLMNFQESIIKIFTQGAVLSMRIFLFDFWNVVNSSGGSERVLSNMANELTKRGYDITVVCCDPKNGSMFFSA